MICKVRRLLAGVAIRYAVGRAITASGERFEEVTSYRVSEASTWAPPVLFRNGILVKDKQTLTRWSLAGDASGSPALRSR